MKLSKDQIRASDDALWTLLTHPVRVIAGFDAAITQATPGGAEMLRRQRGELRAMFPAHGSDTGGKGAC